MVVAKNRTEIVYDIYEHLFWEPQRIWRKKPPVAKYKNRQEVLTNLKGKWWETSLNHILNIFFTFLPSQLLHQFLESSAQEPLWFDEYELYVRDLSGVVDVADIWSITQPDLFLVWEKNIVSIEMKIGIKSSLDQVMKYSLLHHLESQTSGIQKKSYLIFLGIWDFSTVRPKKYKNIQELREALHDFDIESIKKNKKMNYSHYEKAIRTTLKHTTLAYITYQDIADFCVVHIDEVKGNLQVMKLLQWMIDELKDRQLVAL